MKFSIIIATHNAEKSLPKTLDSVLSQTFEDYEVVVIDGKSTDGTQELLSNYEKKFNSFQWVSESDNGIYDAMNKGIDLARGEWLYFLGSGDVLFGPEVLSTVSEAAEKGNTDVIYGNVQWGNTDRIYDGKFNKYKLTQRNICHQAIFYNRKVFEKMGKFSTDYKISADYVFNIKWFNDKKTVIKYLNLIMAVYDTEGSSSKLRDPKFWPERRLLLQKYFPSHILYYAKVVGLFRYLIRGDIRGLKNRLVRKNKKGQE